MTSFELKNNDSVNMDPGIGVGPVPSTSDPLGRKISVLHIARRMSGGVRLHISQLSHGLDSNFYHHHLVTNVKDGDPTFRASPPSSISISNIEINHALATRDLLNIIYLYLSLRKHRFDIIHGHGAKGGLYARLVGRILRTKVVYTPHGGNLHDRHGWWTTKFQASVEKFLFYLTDAFVFESNYARDQFVRKIGKTDNRFVVNYNGIRSKLPHTAPLPDSHRDTIFITAFGRLEYAKGFDLLISAIKILVTKKQLSVFCRIYGEGEEVVSLQNLITDLNLQDKVQLMGHTPEVEQSMAECDIVVQPSRFDSMPYVPLESMSAGKPIIVTRVGGLPEIVTDGVDGLLANPDAEDIATKVAILCRDDTLRQTLVANGYLTLKDKFSLDSMLNGLDMTYKSFFPSNDAK
jgi:glycosyltransferase involved in cell wall biosynthesis